MHKVPEEKDGPTDLGFLVLHKLYAPAIKDKRLLINDRIMKVSVYMLERNGASYSPVKKFLSFHHI